MSAPTSMPLKRVSTIGWLPSQRVRDWRGPRSLLRGSRPLGNASARRLQILAIVHVVIADHVQALERLLALVKDHRLTDALLEGLCVLGDLGNLAHDLLHALDDR